MKITVLDSSGNPVSGASVLIEYLTASGYARWGDGCTNSQGDYSPSTRPDDPNIRVYVRGNCVYTGRIKDMVVRI